MNQLIAEARELMEFHSTGLPATNPKVAELTAELIKDAESGAPRDEVMQDILDLLEIIKGGTAEKRIRPLYDALLAQSSA